MPTKTKAFWRCPECGLETRGMGVASHQGKHRRENFAAWLRRHPVVVGDKLVFTWRHGLGREERYTVLGVGRECVTTRPERTDSADTRCMFRLGGSYALERVRVDPAEVWPANADEWERVP